MVRGEEREEESKAEAASVARELTKFDLPKVAPFTP